jgi:hypothetical protein
MYMGKVWLKNSLSQSEGGLTGTGKQLLSQIPHILQNHNFSLSFSARFRHFQQFWARIILSTPFCVIFLIRCNIIRPFTSISSKWSISITPFPTKPYTLFSSPQYVPTFYKKILLKCKLTLNSSVWFICVLLWYQTTYDEFPQTQNESNPAVLNMVLGGTF